MAQPVQNVVRSVDRASIVTDLQSLENSLWESAALPKFQASIFGAFGLLALVLAMIGIFGVTSHSEQQQTKEIGIRMALGAHVGSVIRGIIAQGAALATIGIVCGLTAALAFARFVESMLFGVRALDTPTNALSSALLLAASLMSLYLPARKAAYTDPIQTLRHD